MSNRDYGFYEDNQSKEGMYSNKQGKKGNYKELAFAPKPKMMLFFAYRGEVEEKKLIQQISLAKETAANLGMEKPLCVMHNALITL